MSDSTLSAPEFLDDVLRGLAQNPKSLSPRWFYDRAGSELFEEITRTPEYYPTRTEIELLRTIGDDVAALVGPGRVVVELGSGSSTKTPLLLRAIAPAAYVPIDISGDFLRESARALKAAMPDLPIYPIEADFTGDFDLPNAVAGLPALAFFPGSTIGNMEPSEAVGFLSGLRRRLRRNMGPDVLLLIGMDRVKSTEILLPAYDDAGGVTARFNLNLLHRINRELAGTIPVEAFRHQARWNADASRIEMHLQARTPVRFTIGGRAFDMAEGETIHTESSHKYTDASARALLRDGGWDAMREWVDPAGLFSVYLAAAAS